GPVRGGLGISVVFVGGLLAATTGIVGATVVAMGLISLPAMLRNNYSHPLATGTIAASGTLGQIIPPSIVLIILADQLSSAVDQASTARKALYKDFTGQLTMPSEFDVTSTSAGEMFLGALIPGLVLVAVYIVFIAILAMVKPNVAPAVPYDGKYDRQFALRVLLALVPPLALIFVVLGSIIMGIATVNQAGAIGAVGAMIMAGYRLKDGQPRAYWPAIIALVSLVVVAIAVEVHPINVKKLDAADDVGWFLVALAGVIGFLFALIWSGWRTFVIEDTLRGVMLETAKTTSLVFIILLGAAMLTAAFRGFGGEDLVRDFLTGMPGGFWGQFFIVMAVIFVLGFFLDFIEIAVVVVPIVAPILLADPQANVTAVWLGVMIGINIQTSFLTPPFGFALFYLRGVAPAAVKTISMYKGVIAFILMQLLVLTIVAFSPRMVNYLPLRLQLASETAPPPLNPKLQVCVEEMVFDEYRGRADEIRAAIAKAKQADLSTLPEELRNDVSASFGNAEKTFGMVQEIDKSVEAINAAIPPYRPLHAKVREVQAEQKRRERIIRDLSTDISRMSRDPENADAVKKLQARVDAHKAEIERLKGSIPANWDEEHKRFLGLVNAEKRGRLLYRRNVDDAYKPVEMAVEILSATPQLVAFGDAMSDIRKALDEKPPAETALLIEVEQQRISAIPGGEPVRAALSNVRRGLTHSTPDVDEARKTMEEATKVYEAELAWRKKGAQELLPALGAYEQTIRYNMGMRQQSRLPEYAAPAMAGCLAHHRDISLYF
ncbi:MAG: TRAP transporter large permease subunit, partial [Hyphomicrobiales bacterium]